LPPSSLCYHPWQPNKRHMSLPPLHTLIHIPQPLPPLLQPLLLLLQLPALRILQVVQRQRTLLSRFVSVPFHHPNSRSLAAPLKFGQSETPDRALPTPTT